MRDKLYLAPLQGFTDRHFRNAFQQCFGDVDRFYAPYLKLNHDGSIKENTKLDVLPENNPFELVIPQAMACSASDLLLMANYLEHLGYKEVNWNLGCPYPMVAKHDLGSGMLAKPELLYAILDEVFSKSSLSLGIKMRMGYESTADILHILPELNNFPLSEVIVHARYGKQLYNGSCDHDRFFECMDLTNHALVYNGDINSVDDFRRLKKRFPTIRKWMIGRGAVSNPFLFEMIQDDSEDFPEDRLEVFHEFLLLLLESHLSETKNGGNVLVKMKHYWEYFSSSFEEGRDYYRWVKRAENLDDYEQVLKKICFQ
jgi:tRNA-dihydrouridine synthase B